MVFFILLNILITACVWHAHVSCLTYWQRSRLWGRPAFKSVSFNAHHWRLLTFRNPWKIYPAGVQEEMA